MTNEEMRMIEETLFPVEAIPAAHPLYEHEGYENMPSGYQYIMRNDTCEIISCMTDDYVLVPNERLMDVAIPTLDKLNARLMEATVFNNARTLYTFTFPDIKIDIDENDLVNPQIIIKNSYDGTVGVNLLAGAFRIVCSNGLVIGFVVGEINTKHLIYNKNIEHLEEIIDISLFKINNIIEKDVKKLVEKAPVKPEHLVKTAGLFPKRMSDYVVQYMIGNQINNYWDLLNSATYVATHKMNRSAESTHKFEEQLYKNIKRMAHA